MNASKVHFEHPVRRELRKKVPVIGNHGATGYTTVADGYETGTVEVTVDLEQIAKSLGPRALANKSGRAKFMKGAIIVKVIRRKKETES